MNFYKSFWRRPENLFQKILWRVQGKALPFSPVLLQPRLFGAVDDIVLEGAG